MLRETTFCALLLAAAAAQQSNTTEPITKNVARPDEVAPSSMETAQATGMAAHYLELAVNPEGRFAYRIETSTGRLSPSYNVVRHAGAIYALGMFYQARPEPQAADTMVRAAAFLRKNYVGPGPKPGQLVVWRKPQPQLSDADLGATGLGLAALAEVNRARPNSVPLDVMQALGNFILFLQKPDGTFYSKYRAVSGPDEEWESLYYPGEAALGLIALYEQDHSKEWLLAAARALAHLAQSRAGLSEVPPDHWALIATARLLPYCAEIDCSVSRNALITHAVQVCHSLLQGRLRNPTNTALDGAFDITGRTAPTATRMEGLLAALEFLPKNEDAPLRKQIKDATTRGIRFLLRTQFHSGPYAGGMPGALIPGPNGNFEIRIDFVQYALCAWLRYKKAALHGSHGGSGSQ